MKLLDRDDPFFRKQWVRVATTALPILWGLAEFAMGAPVWGAVFLAAGIYAGWELFGRR